MRLTILASVCCAAFPAVTELANAQLRPALIGSGPHAAINLVNTQKLMERGQKDALVMFNRVVLTGPIGNAVPTKITYATAESQLLQDALVRALNAADFIPALVDGKSTQVTFYGTATFTIKDGKPHLRIFANQEPDEIAAGHDFVAPQPIATAGKWRDTWEKELNAARVLHKIGTVILSVSIDAAGKPTDVKIVSEKPTGLNWLHFGKGDARSEVYSGIS
jgi:hypothetical protein